MSSKPDGTQSFGRDLFGPHVSLFLDSPPFDLSKIGFIGQ